MKQKLTLLLLFLLNFSFFSFAQDKSQEDRFKKIKTLKVNYISSELDMSPEVAEKFWIVFNEYEQKNRELRSYKIKKIKNTIKQKGGIDNLTEEEAKKISDDFTKITEQFSKNRTETFEKLEEILTAKQILKLNFAEIEFTQKVLKRYKTQR